MPARRQSGFGPNLTIGFVRRGFSSSGGAESYLTRLAAGVSAAGHRVLLFTGPEWPAAEWTVGPIRRVNARSVKSFAREVERLSREQCDVLFSLERIYRCDIYRAGDGVHRAWLEKRDALAGPLQKVSRFFNRKHSATLSLEESLFAKKGAKGVIANSRMVKEEIVRYYGYPADRIDVVYNGVPLEATVRAAEDRAHMRESLGLGPNDVAVLFAGSGWERKGLRFATEAVERQSKQVRLLVAGRGEARRFGSSRAQFLGVVREMPSLYLAADIFLLPTLYDPFSNACLEALAAGKPVITTRANGFSEIIENGRHGTVIESPADVAAISDAIQFWSDGPRRQQAQLENLALAAQFDISRNVRETLSILSRVGA
ncbi:MAG TPA: glycosyltransferase family 4 protein [Chthoniobacterales bacterium]|jgi:UDP-glucose:(heptosyl)LPS alpha-1,3-glucosyltransferase|nr:glycosyltransferase family 4 protein [Chthoniobacterales bacterium]